MADYLFASGFDLVGRNVRLGPLEIDVVARCGSLLALTEVRTRRAGALVGAFASVTRTKRTRVRAAARRLWRQRAEWPALAGIERVRLDVAAVSFEDGVTRVDYAPGALR